MSIKKLETNPEDFKVNKTTTDVNVNRRAKFANKQGFDCQDCDNVVSADATGQNIIFTNYITGAQQTVQPSGNIYPTTGEIARYGDKIWIKNYEYTLILKIQVFEKHVRNIFSLSLSRC